jgi:predicted nuclease with TOPRIM domain
MDLKSLEDKKLAIETSFNELTEQKTDIDSELIRLQGEYRLVDELIKNYKVKETKKNGQ